MDFYLADETDNDLAWCARTLLEMFSPPNNAAAKTAGSIINQRPSEQGDTEFKAIHNNNTQWIECSMNVSPHRAAPPRYLTIGAKCKQIPAHLD